jgi:hypothetical protein
VHASSSSLPRAAGIGLIALTALALIVLAITGNVSNSTIRNNPVLAATVAPYNGLAKDALVSARLALQLQSQQKEASAQALAQAQAQGLITAEQAELVRAELAKAPAVDVPQDPGPARAALRQEPFALFSLVALANSAELRGDKQLSNRLLSHASQLSRRNGLVQMQLIERAGSPAELVRHIDATLRTNQAMFGTVFPLLAQALTDPQLIQLMRPIAKEDPDWYRFFIGEALTMPGALPAIRTLMMAEPNGSTARDPQLRKNLITQLIASDRVALARSYFQSLHKNAARTVVDPRFVHPEFEAPFGWQVNQDPQLTADFVRNEGFSAYGSADREGTFARQLLSLRPGRHVLQLEAETQGTTTLTVSVTCRQGDQAIPVASSRRQSFTFSVPAGCTDQWLSLGLSDNDDASEAEATIRRVALN